MRERGERERGVGKGGWRRDPQVAASFTEEERKEQQVTSIAGLVESMTSRSASFCLPAILPPPAPSPSQLSTERFAALEIREGGSPFHLRHTRAPHTIQGGGLGVSLDCLYSPPSLQPFCAAPQGCCRGCPELWREQTIIIIRGSDTTTLPMAGYYLSHPGAAPFYTEEQEYLQAYEDVLERYKGTVWSLLSWGQPRRRIY